MSKRLALTLTVGLSTGISVSAENWPQWRGPSLNGVSTEKGLPVKWTPRGGHRVEAGDAQPQWGDADRLEQPRSS